MDRHAHLDAADAREVLAAERLLRRKSRRDGIGRGDEGGVERVAAVRNTCPLARSSASRTRWSWRAMATRMASGQASQRWVEPSMSVIRKARTPLGSACPARGTKAVSRTAGEPGIRSLPTSSNSSS
jgi:hypothetical protein